MKKLVSLLLAVIMISSVIIPTFAVENEVVETNAWNTSYTVTGNGANDIVNIALKQENKTMSDLGFNIAWCALFVSKCASLAGQSDAVPNHSVVSTLYSKVKTAGGTVVTNPQKGDLIFYKCTTSNSWCHVGIMTDSVNSVQGNVANKVMYIDYKRYLDTNGSCWTATFVRPKYKGTNTIAYNIKYNANGGTGTISSSTVTYGNNFTVAKSGFTRTGYTLSGYNVYRTSDKRYYTSGGWATTAEISSNGYTKKLYSPGSTYNLDNSWTKGASAGDTFTFYAVWKQNTYNIAYNANGGTGTMSASTIISNGTLTIPACKFTKDGYYCTGYNCYRKSDNTWYTDTAGWKTNTEIYKNGYTKKLYKPGEAFTFGTAWTNGAPVGDTFTFHAIWLKNKPLISFYDNISGSNYISSSLDNKDIFAVNFVSRDTSVHTLSIDTTETLNNQNSLKIVSTTAGSTSSKDFAIATNTNAGMAEEGKNGDSGNMVMTFYAKANKEGTQLNLRWGYSSDIHTVTLTTQWKTYSVTMPKTIYYGAFIHGYLDRAATVYMNNIVVAEKYSSSYLQEDGSLPIEIEYNHGETFEELPIPERPGYTFLGWYTKNVGGTRIDIGSQVPLYNTKLYAQWEKTFSQTPASALETLDGKLYECYDNALSWEDAKAHCESLGGHLVTINSEEENTIVLDLIKDSGRFAWIGASYNTASDCWEWVTGEDFEYTNWIAGQPSNSQSNPEYYAQMMPFNTGLTDSQGKWNDAMGGDGWFSHYGKKNASYVCEYERTEENTEPTYETELPTAPTDITEPTIEPPVPYLPLGDTDGDGRVTILDATAIQRYLAQLPNDVFVDVCADTDKDGVISIVDVTTIQRYLANLITEF